MGMILARGRKWPSSPQAAGNEAQEQNRHRLDVLASRGVDRDQGATSNQPPALARDGDIGSGRGIDPGMDGRCRMSAAVPRLLEDIYAGIEPANRTGDFTDVVMTDVGGRRTL